MWYPNETDYLICHERYQDRQRMAEHDRLVAEIREQDHPAPGQKIRGRLGSYMIRIGLKLQQVETDAAAIYELSATARVAPRR